MKHFFAVLIFIFIAFQINAQVQDTLNQDAAPKGGVNALAIHYYGIDFSKAQREILKEKEIEFIFLVDEKGQATLKEVNGISDGDIMDSLRQRTLTVEPFLPRIKNGIAESSIYFMQLTFPGYKMTQQKFGFLMGAAYTEAKLEDFEYVHRSNSRVDVLFSGMVNQYIGNPTAYLGLGGGFKTEVSIADKRKWIYGLNMSFYGNKRKDDYPISTPRDQFSTPPTLIVGVNFGKWVNRFNIQAELDFGIQNVTERLGNNDEDWVQLKGWSPGIVLNYPIRLGKESTMYYYGAPSLFSHNLNLHFGFRYMKFSLAEASGFMVELGVGYRMSIVSVQEYRLKEGL